MTGIENNNGLANTRPILLRRAGVFQDVKKMILLR
jgi:hypothetical protein